MKPYYGERRQPTPFHNYPAHRQAMLGPIIITSFIFGCFLGATVVLVIQDLT